MKLTAALLGLAVLAAPAALADPGAGNGKDIYDAKCNMCHGTGMANAPLQEKLAALEPAAIVDALNNPKPIMTGVVSSLSDEDKRDVAVFLTKKGLPASGALPEVKPE